MRSAYGAGHLAKSLAWSFTDLLLAYYANMRLGMSAGETGLLLFLSMALGAALDFGVALLLRRLEGHQRAILTIQLLAGMATGAALLMIFRPMHGADTDFLNLLAALGFFRVAYAFYDIAQNALVSLLPEDEADAYRYVIWRQVLGALARIAVAISAFFLVGQVATGHELAAAVAIAVLIVLTAAWIFWQAAGSPVPTAAATVGAWLAMPPGLPRLLLAGAAQAGPLSLAARMVPFVGESSPHSYDGAALLFAFVLGTLVGPLVLPRLRKGGYGAGRGLGYTALTVIAAALFLANTRSGPLALAACLAHGVGLGAIMTLFWGEMSVAIREHALRTGVRTDLTAFALLGATVKLSSAVSGIGLGLLLDGFKIGDPLTMAILAAVTAAGGLCFLLASVPSRRVHAPA